MRSGPRSRRPGRASSTTQAERDREVELGRSLLVAAHRAYSGQPGRQASAIETLAHSAKIAHAVDAPASHLAELRDEVIAAVALADDRPVQKWGELKSAELSNAFSVAADRYANVQLDGSIHVYRLSDRRELKVLPGDGQLGACGRCSFRVGGFLRSWPTQTFSSSGISSAPQYPRAGRPTYARGRTARRASGGRIAVDGRASGLRSAFALPEIEMLPGLQNSQVLYLRLDFSLTERAAACGRFPGPDLEVARVVDVESGRIDREFKLPTARVGRALALNRTGNLLAIVHDRVISVFDMADGEQLSLLQGHQSEGIVVQFQPSGDLLVSSSWDGTTRLWDPIRGRPLARPSRESFVNGSTVDRAWPWAGGMT